MSLARAYDPCPPAQEPEPIPLPLARWGVLLALLFVELIVLTLWVDMQALYRDGAGGPRWSCGAAPPR